MENNPKKFKFNWKATLLTIVVGVASGWGYVKFAKELKDVNTTEKPKEIRESVTQPPVEPINGGGGDKQPIGQGSEILEGGSTLAAVCPEQEPVQCPDVEPTVCPPTPRCEPEIITVPKIEKQIVKVPVKVEKPWDFGCNIDWERQLVAAVGDPDTRVICEVNWATREVRRRIESFLYFGANCPECGAMKYVSWDMWYYHGGLVECFNCEKAFKMQEPWG